MLSWSRLISECHCGVNRKHSVDWFFKKGVHRYQIGLESIIHKVWVKQKKHHLVLKLIGMKASFKNEPQAQSNPLCHKHEKGSGNWDILLLNRGSRNVLFNLVKENRLNQTLSPNVPKLLEVNSFIFWVQWVTFIYVVWESKKLKVLKDSSRGSCLHSALPTRMLVVPCPNVKHEPENPILHF